MQINIFRSKLICFQVRNYSRPAIQAGKYISLLRQETKDPIYSLIQGVNARNSSITGIRSGHYHLGKEQLAEWKPILSAGDIILALQAWDGLRNQILAGSHRNGSLPPWVVLSLVAYKVRTPTHAGAGMVDFVKSFIDLDGPQSQRYSAPLLILACMHLAHFSLFLPLNTFAREFFMLPLPAASSLSTFYFNLFLSALAHIPTASTQKAKLISETLKRMEGRQMSISHSSFLSVMSDPYVNIELSSYLRDVARRRGFVPQREHIETQLRAYGTAGDSKGLFNMVHELNHKTRLELEKKNNDTSDWYSDPKPMPYYDTRMRGIGKGTTALEKDFTHPNNALLLRGSRDPSSAFEFLRRMLKADSTTSTHSQQISKALNLRSHPARSLSQPTFANSKKFRVDIYDFTSALTVAAKSPDVSERQLLKLFGKAKTLSPAFRPTIATYSIVMLGLMRRQSNELAVLLFDRVIESGLQMDVICMNMGVKALVRVGQLHRAIYELAHFSGVLKQLNLNSTAATQHTTVGKIVKPNVVMTNELFAALNHQSRPDVVFRLWDALHILFGVLPNERTLCILLQSARTARKLDDSIRGTIAYFALKNPFRGKRRRGDLLAVQSEVWQNIVDVIGDHSEQTCKAYRDGVWHDMLPLDAAAEIFVRAVCGQAMSQGGKGLYDELVNTQAPAHAIRSDDGDRPHLRPRHLPPLDPPPNILDPQGRSWYPSILLTEEGFRDYIITLSRGAGHGKAEIPRALAWMKVLGIQPDRNTLAASMVLFSEVSMSPIGISAVGLNGKRLSKRRIVPGVNQYEVFVAWVIEWVGEAAMPNDEQLGRWVRSIGRQRYGPPTATTTTATRKKRG